MGKSAMTFEATPEEVPPHALTAYRPVKRLFDITFCLALLPLVLPVMLIVAIAVWMDSPGPILFRQKRVGCQNRLFVIYKFRSMTWGTPDVAKSDLVKQHATVTRVGRIIRRTSLDELPQLFNVFRGDMSLVGPRPALHNQDDLIRMRTQLGVHMLTPGMTGLAQVNGREALGLGDKVAYDHEYLKNFGLVQDLRIVLRTVIVLFSAKGTF